jgi:hypothetical protein
MTCSRCAGLMVEDYLITIDIDSPRGDQKLFAWRCINCGSIVERVMNLNRFTSQSQPMDRSEAQKSALEGSERA